jgi:hypothetical protein
MRLMVDTAGVTFTVCKAAEPKMELGNRQQKTDRQTGAPQWVVEVFALDESGGEVIRVTVTGDQPKVVPGQPVIIRDLEAVPWTNNGRSGVAYRAASIVSNAQPKAA